MLGSLLGDLLRRQLAQPRAQEGELCGVGLPGIWIDGGSILHGALESLKNRLLKGGWIAAAANAELPLERCILGLQ